MRSRRFLWILLAILGIGFLALVVHHEEHVAGEFSRDDFAGLVYNGALALFVGSLVIALFQNRFTQALEAVLLWIVLATLVALGYTYRAELRTVGDRVLAELVPGRVVARGQVVEIARGRNGEFRVTTQVNSANVPMVLDTGASAVVLTHEAATAAGLPVQVLNYSVVVETANGRTRAAAVVLDRLTVGNIVERSVPALIAQAGHLRTSLLGMSFLNRLESWEVRGDKLLMRGTPRGEEVPRPKPVRHVSSLAGR